jgi:hypothetical protein
VGDGDWVITFPKLQPLEKLIAQKHRTLEKFLVEHRTLEKLPAEEKLLANKFLVRPDSCLNL